MKRIKPLDIAVFLIILALSIFSMMKVPALKGETVCVKGDNDNYQFSLNENGCHQIEGPLGITTVEIKDKKVRIIDSPCPGKTCVNQGWHSPIVCLPNKVIVTIENYGDFDAIAE